MTVIRCPPSDYEYTIKYQDKTYHGEYKKIQNAVRQVGISSPIMHYPYICQEEGCGIRFMFHADITEHYMLHHNILNPKIEFKKLNFPTHRYPSETRRNDGFYTINELMNFNEDDFKKHNVFFNRKSKSTTVIESSCPLKKKKSGPSIEKIEHLLSDFATVYEVPYVDEKGDILGDLGKNEYLESGKKVPKDEGNMDNVKIGGGNNEGTMVIDLTKAPEDGDSDDGIEYLGDYSSIKNSDTKSYASDHSEQHTSTPASSPYIKSSQQSRQSLSSSLNNLGAPDQPSRLTQTLPMRFSPGIQMKNASVERQIPPKITTGVGRSGSPKKHFPNINKPNNLLPGHINSSSKPKDDKDVLRKVTQILHENVPKRLSGPSKCNNVDETNNSSNFNTLKNHNPKQTTAISRPYQKTTNQDHQSQDKISSVSSTNMVAKSNGIPKRVDKLYYCMFSDDCNFFTRYRINYEKHMSDHAIITFLFRCNTCPLVFQTENVFIEHKTKYCIKSVGQVRPKFNPDISRHQEFINLANYYDLITCRYSDVCSFVCNKKEELRYHIQQIHEHDQVLYNCSKCEAQFKNKVALAIHSRNYCWKTMEMQIAEGKLMTCNAECCDFSSYSIPEWHVHMASHLYTGDQTPYECGKCYTFLATKTAQVEHEKYFCPLIKPKIIDLPNRHHF
uniref:C2H2-type domain-containing protein n=1 Tax=Strongyloides papillosus TaxID=174720 RepID=A0A0N5BE50_STREA